MSFETLMPPPATAKPAISNRPADEARTAPPKITFGGGWTEQAIAELKFQWNEGKSASEVAAILREKFGFAVSRSAVCGKVDRLGLSDGRPPRTKKSGPRRQPRRTHAPRLPRHVPSRPTPIRAAQPATKPAPRPVPQVGLAAPAPKHIRLEALNKITCKWPHGDGPFTFCGHARFDRSVYCEYHTRLSYSPAQTERSREVAG